MTDEEALQLIDDSPCSWTWVLTGPLFYEDQRWRCEVLGLFDEVVAFGETRAEAIAKAHALGVVADAKPRDFSGRERLR